MTLGQRIAVNRQNKHLDPIIILVPHWLDLIGSHKPGDLLMEP